MEETLEVIRTNTAEANGASGLIIFTDPQLVVLQEDLYIQKVHFIIHLLYKGGHSLTTDFTGDPLTFLSQHYLWMVKRK